MSSADPLAALEDAERNELELLLMEFEQAWSPELLSDYCGRLESQTAARHQQLAISELVKIDLQRRWSSGEGLLLEDYCRQIPSLGSATKINSDLILIEFEARRDIDASLKLCSYASRFPAQFERLAHLARANIDSSLSTKAPESQTDEEASKASIETSRVGDARDTKPTKKGQQTALPDEFGRYRILRELGSGAMGTVYLAHDSQLDRQVALKTPSFTDEGDELITRFYREARAAAKVQHRNICPIYDVGKIDGRHFISMAYVEGKAMAKYITPDKLPSPKTSAILIHRLASALAEAHHQNVIHRDLKPTNILIDATKEPVVMDFGLACQTDLESRMTKSGTMVGTPAYMSPEQLSGDPTEVGPAADIYSLGVIFYELLTGDIPFRGSIAQVVYKITYEEPVAPSQISSEIDPDLESICAQMMTKRVDERFESMDAVAAALKDYLKSPNQKAEVALGEPTTEPDSSVSAENDSSKTNSGEVSEGSALNAFFAAADTDHAGPKLIEPALSTERQPSPNTLPAPFRRWTAWIYALVGVVILMGTAFLVRTPSGMIRVEVLADVEGLEVLVDGNVVNLADAAKARPGEHDLALKIGGTRLQLDPTTCRFEVIRNGAQSWLTVSIGDVQLASNTFTVESRWETVLKIVLISAPPPMIHGLEFDGIDDAVETSLSYNGTHPITIEAHVTPFAIRRGCYGIIANMQQGDGLGLFLLNNVWIASGGTTEANPPRQRIYSKQTAKPGRRVHVAATYDLKKLALFVGGKLMGERVLEGGHRPSSLPFVIGRDPTEGNHFRGLIDEVRISDAVRYHRDFTPVDRFVADDKTLVLYEFDEDTDNAAHDTSVNGHHGIIHGAKWVQLRRTSGKSKEAPAPPLEMTPFDETTAKAHQQAWADFLNVPVEKEIDLPDGEKLSLMLIPPGSFLVGSTDADRARFLEEARARRDAVAAGRIPSEGPQRWVRIDQPFYLGKNELTQAQWEAVMGNNPSEFRAPRNPVEKLSWNDTAWFLGKLNMQQQAGLRFVMPTEAQWEYACRAGSMTAWYSDETQATLQAHAWFAANANGRTHWVGQLKPNAWGLHDMYGNVCEWCADRFGMNYYRQAPPNDSAGPTIGKNRVHRGGGFGDRAAYCRSAHRDYSFPTRARNQFGFRLAAVLEDVVLVDRPREPDWPDILPAGALAPAIAPFDQLAAKRHQKAWADYLGVSVEREVDLPDGAKLKMVLIPPGEFVMGLPEAFELAEDSPQRQVRITQPFWLSQHEITRGQFRRFAEADAYKTEPELDGGGGTGLLNGKLDRDPRYNWGNVGFPQTDDHPVVNVTSNDAAAFCQWLSKQQGSVNYELPTAAQWEFACRAGQSMAFWHFGSDEAEMSKYEWFQENAGETTHPVGQLLPNAFGLHDMHGNVTEWCADWFGWDYVQTPTNDPAGLPYSGSLRVVRGGCWEAGAALCRSTIEDRRGPGMRARWLGFRVAQPIDDAYAHPEDDIVEPEEKTDSGQLPETGFMRLFDGSTFNGWEGSNTHFRIKDGSIVAGSLVSGRARTEYLTYMQEFGDFDLRAKVKLVGNAANGGIQFRSHRGPEVRGKGDRSVSRAPYHDLIGYQADMGTTRGTVWWGKLYDQSRRKRVLAGPDNDEELTSLVRVDDWNDFRVRCQGARVRIWLNGRMTVDYTERDKAVEPRGLIGLQAHRGPPFEAWYRDIRIKEIKDSGLAEPDVLQPNIPLGYLREAGFGDLEKALPTKLDEFNKDSPSTVGKSLWRGNAEGRFFIECKGGFLAWNKARLANGIFEVTGRVASDKGASWFLHLQHWPPVPPNEARGVRVAVSSSGRVVFGDSFFPPGHESFFPDKILAELGPNAASEFHTIGVILRDRTIRLFCDGEPISDELKLDFELAPGVVALGVQGKGRAEFERVATWKASDDGDDWEPLFDGKTLDGWRIEGGQDWSVEQGEIIARAKRSRLVTVSDDFGDFEVRLKCKLATGANSGIHARTVFGEGWKSGYEAQLSNQLSQGTLTGGIYGHTAVKEQLIPDDQWFELRYRVVGTELTVFVNGKMTSQTKVEAGPSRGSIALQSWDENETRFRNVEVRRL